MRWKISVILLFILVSPICAQNLFVYKDAAFAQVAAGGGWETRITLHNRGLFVYEGTLAFHTGEGSPWNPIVDGVQITGGEIPIQLLEGETNSLRITGSSSVAVGNAILASADLILDNFIETNLTYFLKSGDKTIDSIGVLPSSEFYLATVPFENFSNIALALGNAAIYDNPQTANVELRLFDHTGARVGDPVTITLQPKAHTAKFLTEIFGGNPVTRGKLELHSEFPAIGTVLTSIDGQNSSLPLKPSPIGFWVQMTFSDDRVWNGKITLAIEGYLVNGYMVIEEAEGEPVSNAGFNLVTGQMIDNFMDLNFIGQENPFGEFVLIHMEQQDFSYSYSDQGGTFFITYLDDQSLESGTYTITKMEP